MVARTIAGWVMVATLASAVPVAARGPRGGHGGAFLAVAPHHGHPINAWLGSRRLRLR